MILSEAITHAMGDCEKEGILAEFLRENGSEAVNMLFTEFNMEDALDVRYDEGMQTGAKQKAEEIAIRMLKEGKLTVEEISVYVDELSIEEIETLKCNLSDDDKGEESV